MTNHKLTATLAATAMLLLLTGRVDAGSQLLQFKTTVDAPSSEVGDVTVRAWFSEVVNGQFTLTLSYLSADIPKKFVAAAVLTGFTWETDTTATIVANSATVHGGSKLVNKTPSSGTGKSKLPAQPNPVPGSGGTDVSAWWMFDEGTAGMGTAGGNLFGRTNLIDTGGNPGGVDYGLVPEVGIGPTVDFNLNDSKQLPVIQSSLVLTFTVDNGTFDPITEITSGKFLFGSELHAFDAGSPTVIPEPSSLALLGIGLVTVAGRRWRNRRRGPDPQD